MTHIYPNRTIYSSCLSLSDNFHILKLSFNLLSVGQFCKLGIDLLFTNHGVACSSWSSILILSLVVSFSMSFRFSSVSKFDCTSCHFGKQTKFPFNNSDSFSSAPFDLIRSDIWGLFPLRGDLDILSY